MTPNFILPAAERLECACAIFDADGPLYVSPAYRAYFGDRFAPPIAVGDAMTYLFTSPVAFLASRSDFVLGEVCYTLFNTVLCREGEERDQAEHRLYRADSAFAYLLRLATAEGRGTPCKIMEIFDSVYALIWEHVTDTVQAEEPLYETASVVADHMALTAVLGLLLPDLMQGRDPCITFHREGWDDFILRISGCGSAISPFFSLFAGAISSASGFDLAVSEEGISFTFHRCIPYSSVLYAGNGAGDMLACLRIALSLRGWEKA